MNRISPMQDLIEVDSLNIGGILLWVSHMIWFPASVYEFITTVIGWCVGISLIALNIKKFREPDRKKKQSP